MREAGISDVISSAISSAAPTTHVGELATCCDYRIAGATVASRLPNLALLVVAFGFIRLFPDDKPAPKKTT